MNLASQVKDSTSTVPCHKFAESVIDRLTFRGEAGDLLRLAHDFVVDDNVCSHVYQYTHRDVYRRYCATGKALSASAVRISLGSMKRMFSWITSSSLMSVVPRSRKT